MLWIAFAIIVHAFAIIFLAFCLRGNLKNNKKANVINNFLKIKGSHNQIKSSLAPSNETQSH